MRIIIYLVCIVSNFYFSLDASLAGQKLIIQDEIILTAIATELHQRMDSQTNIDKIMEIVESAYNECKMNEHLFLWDRIEIGFSKYSGNNKNLVKDLLKESLARASVMLRRREVLIPCVFFKSTDRYYEDGFIKRSLLKHLDTMSKNRKFKGVDVDTLYNTLILEAVNNMKKDRRQDVLWNEVIRLLAQYQYIDNKVEILQNLHELLYYVNEDANNGGLYLSYKIFDNKNIIALTPKEAKFILSSHGVNMVSVQPSLDSHAQPLNSNLSQVQENKIQLFKIFQELKVELKKKILAFQGWKKRHQELLEWADNLKEEDLRVDDNFQKLSKVVFNSGIVIANNGQEKLKTWLNELALEYKARKLSLSLPDDSVEK